nr:MAG TPA: hypothetical protein [Caudoviricetes sp.]
MTTRLKKSLVWYGIFITALILNQTKSFADDITVKVVVHGLWVTLVIVTWMFFKESKWD